MGLASIFIKGAMKSSKRGSSSSSILSSVSTIGSVGGKAASAGLSIASFAGKELYIIGSGVIGLIIFLLR